MADGKRTNHFDWKILIVIILLCITIFVSIIYVRAFAEQKEQISILNQRINYLLNGQLINNSERSDKELFQYYSALSEKTDNLVDEIIGIVTILFGISTASGLVIAFRAPRNIEQEIEVAKKTVSKLESLIAKTNKQLKEKMDQAEKSASDAKTSATEAKSDASEARFEMALHEALDNETEAKRKEALDSLIVEYSDKSRLYVERARVTVNLEDVIKDLNAAREHGYSKTGCSNELARAYFTREMYDEAIEVLSNAIEDEKSTAVYINLARTYCIKAEDASIEIIEKQSLFQKCLELLNEVEKTDSQNINVFLWKARVYRDLIECCEIDESDNYIIFIQKATNIDRETTAKFLMEYEFSSLCRDNHLKDDHALLTESLIKLALFELERSNVLEAFRLIIDAYYASIFPYYDSDNYTEIINIAASIILMFNNVLASESKFILSGENGRMFLASIYSYSVKLYMKGNHEEASKLFTYQYFIKGENANKDSIINCLVYMMRREEIKTSPENIFHLLEKVKNKESLFICINKAFLVLKHAETYEEEYRKIIENMKGINFVDSDVKKVLQWWGNEEIVGKDERAFVMQLLKDIGLNTTSSENV
ncbi:hypothetical protein SDC9_79279 [bioreactor metagenome]|uniref:Uncharacterized protein n=1 Tax=bioreactor metagenome TaxID=1076179 RepID=A0A644Z3L4_9ZZZZ